MNTAVLSPAVLKPTAINSPKVQPVKSRPAKAWPNGMELSDSFDAHSMLTRTATLVQTSLAELPYPDARSLCIEIEDQSIVISGRLESYYHKQIVQSHLAFAYRSVELIDQMVVQQR